MLQVSASREKYSMPHFCPHCNAEIADKSVQCPHCGQPQTASSPQDQQADSDRRFPFWTILPWTLLAAAALFFLPHLLRSSQTGSAPAAASQPLTAHAPSASAVPAASVAVPIAPALVPLTVTLSSASSTRHVPVGKPIMISAYASLPPGQSATLAISYGKDGGPKTLLALAQGSLSSAAWTPTAPGRYRFTASALDSRKNGAFSHHLTILVDGPPPVPAAVKPASAKLTAAEPSIRRTQIKAAAAPRPRVRTIPLPQPYHVAAASFRVKRIADTLAGALRQRGFHAFVRPAARGQYRVETGDFVRRADAQKQMRLLQRDGYPSSVFQTE